MKLTFHNLLTFKENKMAQEWLKKYLRMKPEVNQLFDDLEVYQQFCKDYGYPYDEKHLYNERSPYGELLKMVRGREPWDQWRTPKRHFHHKARA
jgi:hypothetical protein